MGGQRTIASFFAASPKPAAGGAAAVKTKPADPAPTAAIGGQRPAGISLGQGPPAKKQKKATTPAPAPAAAAVARDEKSKPVVVKQSQASAGSKGAATTDPPTSQPTSHDSNGSDLVGKRIRVWWKAEREWFAGRVDAANPNGSKVHVEYDDGDEEWITLGKRKHEWIGGGGVEGGTPKRAAKDRAAKRHRRSCVILDDSDSDDDADGSDGDAAGDGDSDYDDGVSASSESEDEEDDDLSVEVLDEEEQEEEKEAKAKPSEGSKGKRKAPGLGKSGQAVKATRAIEAPTRKVGLEGGACDPLAPTRTPTHRKRAPGFNVSEGPLMSAMEASAFLFGTGASQFAKREEERFPFLRPDAIRDIKVG